MGGRRSSAVVEIWQSLWMLMDGLEGERGEILVEDGYS